jgi:predicted nuclease with TOPRIM domain
MTDNVERLKELERLVAEQESLIQRMIVRGTPNQAAEDHLRRLKQELAQIKSLQGR